MTSITSLTSSKQIFNSSVIEFKKQHNITLKKLLDFINQDSLQLRKEFWSQHKIRSYLSRESDITFSQFHPIFDTDRQNKLNNDYYESRIYQLASEQSWRIFPFRNKVLSDEFYLSGTEAFNRIGEDDSFVRAKESLELNSFIKVNHIDDILVTVAEDYYQIRQRLLNFQHLQNINNRFVISPNYSSNHATTLLSILEKGTDRLLLSIHIDSQKCKYFLSKTQNGFINQGGSWSNNISYTQAEEKYLKFKEELKGSQLKIDTENRIAYLLDEKYFCAKSTPNIKQITEAEIEKKVDIIHNLSHYRDGQICYLIFDRRPVAFIDASNLLQTAPDDQNCAIYTFNTMQAVIKLLEDKSNSETVYELALKIGHGTEFEKQQAEEAIIKIFREDIKAYLPCYFNEDGKSKSESELKEFHLKQRWQLGSMAASNEKYLIYKHFLPESKQ